MNCPFNDALSEWKLSIVGTGQITDSWWMCFRVNSGFEEQLCLYETMKCEVDISSPLYKQYRLTKITEKYPGKHTHTHTHTTWVGDLCYSRFSLCLCVRVCLHAWTELQHVPRELFAADPAHSSSSEVSYRCRKCR